MLLELHGCVVRERVEREHVGGYMCVGACARVHVRGCMCAGACARVHVRAVNILPAKITAINICTAIVGQFFL